MNERREDLEIDLQKLLLACFRKWWAIAISAIIAGVLVLLITVNFITPLYKASALMYVNNSSISVGNTTVSLSDLSAAQSLVDTYIVILESRSTLNDVIAEADLEYSYKELVDMIEAAPVDSTEVFEIVVTSPDPYEAEKIANVIAELLPEKISGIVEGSSVRIVDYAVVPSEKASPSLTKNTAIGLILGAILSIIAIILMELFDEQIRGEAYLRETYDLPILASIPDLRTSSAKTANEYYVRKEGAK